jgi:hypothetical protein
MHIWAFQTVLDRVATLPASVRHCKSVFATQDGLAFGKRNQKTPLLLACVLQVHSFLPHGVRHSVLAIHFTPTDV